MLSIDSNNLFYRWVVLCNPTIKYKGEKGTLDGCAFISGIFSAILTSLFVVSTIFTIVLVLVLAPIQGIYEWVNFAGTWTQFNNQVLSHQSVTILGYMMDFTILIIFIMALSMFIYNEFMRRYFYAVYIAPPRPNIVKVLYKSWKDKYCIKINIV